MISSLNRPLDPASDRVQAHLTRGAARLSQIRRHLHRNPELSGQEFSTTDYLSKQLTAARVPHRVAAGKCGIITDVIESPDSGAPIVAMRADIDALPIKEENNVPYRSKRAGVMHACGHDAHSAILLGTTLALYRARPLPVAWRSIFQPAEEAGRGACEMVNQGALEGVDAIIGLHVDPNLPVGRVAITPGPRTAFCQDFAIEIGGRGGHGARPHTTADPIAAAAHLITLIYQAVPRQTDARQPVVVTIGMVNAGFASNVIPDTASLQGTIRTLNTAVAVQTRETVERLCASVAQAFGAKISPVFERLLPGLVNDAQIATLAAGVAGQLLGPENILRNEPPSMGAEDFADYLPVVPGCMIGLGAKGPDRKITPLHTATFDIDETALLIGARLFAAILLEWPKKVGPAQVGRSSA
ncbi:MAG TPA: amidohydrolase [Chthoniobacterales bacterium]|jgi:amidohydrolase|nr:amidohydrolase [Chthoniobacterales bacterium]